MATEIEHKYLVNLDLWKNVIPAKSSVILQAYMLTDPNKTIRVRTKNEKGFITIKGKTNGASRLEFEYEIPLMEAHELIENFCTNKIEKVRHEIFVKGKLWEVDEFKDLNIGLIVAEIELSSENEEYAIPEWVGENVTSDMRYANSNLAINPFINW